MLFLHINFIYSYMSGLWQVMDMLVEQTHEIRHELRQNDKAMRYTDTRLDEQDRGISVKMVPMSLLLPSSSGKSFLFNLIDTPGTYHLLLTGSFSPPSRPGHVCTTISLADMMILVDLVPMSLQLPSSFASPCFLFNLIDTPDALSAVQLWGR